MIATFFSAMRKLKTNFGIIFGIKMRKLFLTVCILFLMAGIATAQTERDSTEEDPFKNDPFFSAPLKEMLKKPSHNNDSTDDIENDRDVRNFVVDLNDHGLDFEGIIEAGPYNSNPLYSVYPNLPMIHFNRVNALFLGLRKERMQWYQDDWLLGIPDVQLTGLIGYSTGQKDWEYSIGAEKLFGRKNHLLIGGEYHNASSTNDEWRVGLHETSVTAFAGGYDYLDYYKQRGWGAYMLLRSDRFFEGGVALSDDRYNSLINETDWALFGAGNRYRPNPPVDVINGLAVDTVNISSLTLSASFNPKRLVLSRHFTFSLTGIAELADPGMGSSDYNYQKYTGELISYLNFEPGGVLKYRLRMSSIAGEAPRFKQLYLGGIGTMRALPFKSLSGNQMVLSNAELQFGTARYHSDGWIDFEDFYLSLFLDSGWTDFSQDLVDSGDPFTGFDEFNFEDLQHNGGIGIGSSLIRCELAWDLENTSRAPVFWIRFNPTF